MKSIKEFKPSIDLLKEDKWKFIFYGVLILVIESTSVFSGYLNGAAIESITEMNLKKALMYFLIYFVYSAFFRGVLSIYANNGLVKMESKLTRKIGYQTYNKALYLPAYAYEKMSSGEVINRISNDSDTLSFTFRHLIRMFGQFISSIIILFYIFYESYIVGIEIILIMSILFFVMKHYNPKMKKAHTERKEYNDKFVALTNESIRGVREIKTLGLKKNLLVEMKKLTDKLLVKSYKEIDYDNQFNMITRVLRVILEVGTFMTCSVLLYYKQITLTFFIAMTYYIYNYMYLIDGVTEFYVTYQRVTVALSRINELLLNKKYKDESFGDKELTTVKGEVEFKNVKFGYPGEKEILNGFDLKIEPNKKIAIVGKSGQGKSTLFNLLTRVFDPKGGMITLDGVDIKTLSEDNLRKNISIIRQEPFIFNRTIKDNFRILDSKITLKEIREYTKKAYLDDYIMSLPKKYDTLLGEGGVNLSGGQKQRLSIARTLAKKSKVILFDEATSALDNNSQEFIKKTIDNLVSDHTIIIVAHRLSTIIDADIIYVVDNGKIVGSGKHQDLLKNNKIYKKLYETENIE